MGGALCKYFCCCCYYQQLHRVSTPQPPPQPSRPPQPQPKRSSSPLPSPRTLIQQYEHIRDQKQLSDLPLILNIMQNTNWKDPRNSKAYQRDKVVPKQLSQQEEEECVVTVAVPMAVPVFTTTMDTKEPSAPPSIQVVGSMHRC